MRPMPLLLTLVLLPITTPAPPALRPPVRPAVVVARFHAPMDEYGAGHRGIDLRALPGTPVVAPMDGIVTFVGTVAGKDVVSITDGPRIASMEPVRSALPIGRWVRSGDVIGTVGQGGHCDHRCVHLGLRVDGTYRPPLTLRARLLP